MQPHNVEIIRSSSSFGIYSDLKSGGFFLLGRADTRRQLVRNHDNWNVDGALPFLDLLPA